MTTTAIIPKNIMKLMLADSGGGGMGIGVLVGRCILVGWFSTGSGVSCAWNRIT